MSARDEILNRLRARAHDLAPPPPWQSRQDYADLAAQFTRALAASAGEVHRAASLEAALEQLDALLQNLGARKVVSNSIPRSALRTPHTYDWLDVGESAAPSETGLRDFCETADVGLSGADAALAETGSIVISSGAQKSRLATLLPSVHIALAPTSCLTADIFTWAAARQSAGLSPRPVANITLVSGPSKTADIEQTLTIGVHGPKRFIVILYD